MHILFLSDNFPPEVNAPASRTFEHCREWVRSGHRVTVVTCAPNFPRGEVFGGYRNKLWQSQMLHGIRVIRVWTYMVPNSGASKRILDYLSYMLMATIAAPFVRGADVVVATSPQFFAAVAGYLVSRIKRLPFVFELRDLWPESIKAVEAIRETAFLRWMERLELFLYRKAAAVVTVTHAFRRNLIARGIDGDKIAVVTNGVDTARFHPRPRDAALAEQYGLSGRFVAGYVGTHGLAHALETVLEAAARLREEPQGDRVRFVLLGDGARKPALQEMARARGLDNVVFIDSVMKREVARHWSLLDVSIIHLKKTELFTTVIPSKLFECMGMGIPVLHGVAGESAEIVEREGVGLVFEPENVAALCDGLRRLAGDAELYQRLRRHCIEAAPHYDRSVLAQRMFGVFERVTEGRRRGPVPAP